MSSPWKPITMPPSELRSALPLLRPRLPRLLLAIALGSLALGSALALAGVSAWLITRAWQMPPVLDLSVAVVAVRTFGISRGVLGYCERLASHDTALRAAASARSEIYRRLARGPADITARLHSGDLLARVGADVDTLADVLVRALVPIGVAGVLGVSATAVIAMISPAVAVVLAVCLLVAGVLAPGLSARAVHAQEAVARQQQSGRDVAAVTALEYAAELRVAGRLPAVIAEAEQRQRDWGSAIDRAAAPAAAAAAVPILAIGTSVLGAVTIGIGIAAHTAPTTLAVLMLLPLSAFEATAMLPAAAVALTRARIAAARLHDLLPATTDTTEPVVIATHATTPTVRAQLRAGYPGGPAGQPIEVTLQPGARLAITGRSGAGKTALLMSLAGLIPPATGTVTLDGVPTTALTESQLRSVVCYFAEDAHLFSTTVRDNLLVARGDCTDEELAHTLAVVGLRDWLASLPDGLATVLAGGAGAVSAGQRRRLLLARVLLCPAPVVLLDEPTEHLDAADGQRILRALLDDRQGLLSPARTVVVATHQLGNDIACPRLSIGNDG
ncbi:thiol reductant ABC exporter subunit CydC [Mycobacterium sp. CVI_P3]|uniref:Thiol reductant ABC exporter subunit CydC n=1 Tax=Mycobacterium pinniadriaticum TaxID=2994102 RepID=A0ABT3SBC5_9MYCO|nr:thiol reductant ABC exporter subunit CydC [Mycobacterium pinniadriaticum]MCX2930126.1 thiol reductant ABC exporter subunit CydC [Mycobacterium pinniadriaticum]MCX2936812.1 thiol reductant ABC exporter subunit CydC [Mycobacterium pinniadriaticum]